MNRTPNSRLVVFLDPDLWMMVMFCESGSDDTSHCSADDRASEQQFELLLFQKLLRILNENAEDEQDSQRHRSTDLHVDEFEFTCIL